MTLIDRDVLNPRYLKMRDSSTAWKPYSSVVQKVNSKEAITLEQKFSKSKTITTALSSYLCLRGEEEFQAKCCFLDELINGWKAGKIYHLKVGWRS